MVDNTATERKRRQRLREKLAEAEKDPLNLNIGMKPFKDVFPTQEDYLAANPDKTKTDYIKLKIAWDRETVQNERQIEQEDKAEFSKYMTLTPYNPKSRATCSTFRSAYLSFSMSNADWRIQNHNAVCSFCAKWLSTYNKNINLSHVDFWGESKQEDSVDRARREMGFVAVCPNCFASLKNGYCSNCGFKENEC